MIDLLYQLFRPFAFGAVRHPSLRPLLRFAPWIVSAVCTLVFFLLPVRPPITGSAGLTSNLLIVFAILPGFYIAALAAVATFDRDLMDLVMPDPAPTLKLRTGHTSSHVELTFRLFLCTMFSYLTAMSFLAVFFFVAAQLISPSIQAVTDTSNSLFVIVLKIIYVAVALWLASKIIITTLLGLYFMAERMHRPDG